MSYASTRRKTLEALERSTVGPLSHETSLTKLGFSGERHNVRTACATRANENENVGPNFVVWAL